MSYRLPIFPLSVVLFPGAPLPLHIFEPRYREMVSDCMASDKRFGLVLPGRETETPAPGAIGCVAEVRAQQELPDGRSNIIVVGETRFTIASYVETTLPYAMAMVDDLDDLPGTDPAPDDVSAVAAAFERYFELLRRLNEIEAGELEIETDPRALSFRVAAALQIGPAAKQRLLETRSTAERLTIVLHLLPGLTTQVESNLRVHERARSNGTGGSHPDIVADA